MPSSEIMFWNRALPKYVHRYTYILLWKALYQNTIFELGIDIASSFPGMSFNASLKGALHLYPHAKANQRKRLELYGHSKFWKYIMVIYQRWYITKHITLIICIHYIIHIKVANEYKENDTSAGLRNSFLLAAGRPKKRLPVQIEKHKFHASLMVSEVVPKSPPRGHSGAPVAHLRSITAGLWCVGDSNKT